MKAAVAPSRRKPLQARAARTVETLLQAAALVIEERGPAGYNTNAVCERAGVSIGSLYQYFSNKDMLTAALIEREHERMVGWLRALMDDTLGQPLDAVVDRIVEECRAASRAQPVLSHFLEQEEERLPRSPALLALEKEIVVLNRQLLRRYLKPTLTDSELDIATLNTVVIVRSLTGVEPLTAHPPTPWCGTGVQRAVLGYLQPMMR